MVVNREFVDSGTSGLTSTSNTVISGTGDYLFQCSNLVDQLGRVILTTNTNWYNRIMASSTIFIEKFQETSGFGRSISDDELVREMIINEALLGKYRTRTEGIRSWDVIETNNSIEKSSTVWSPNAPSLFEDLRDAILSFG